MKILFNTLVTTLVITSNIVVSFESSFAAQTEQPVRTFSNPSSNFLAETDAVKKQKAEQEAQRQKKREEAAANQKKKAEEAAALRAKKQEEAALNKKKAEELAAQKKKQQEETAAAQKNKAEELAAQRKKQKEDAAAAQKSKAEELAAQRKKQQEDAVAAQKNKAAERKKQQEDAAAAQKSKAEELAAQRKKQKEDAAAAQKKKAEDLAAAQQQKRDELACKNVEIRSSGNRSREFGRNSTWKSCKYKLHFQGDGNFVLIDPSGKVLWATGTEGRATKLALQPDGNVVLYDKQAKAVWATNTDRSPGAFFALQRDGNFVVYNGSNPIWATNTSGGRFTTVSAASGWTGNISTEKSPVVISSKPTQPISNSNPVKPLSSLRETIPNCLFSKPCVGGGSQHTGVDYFIDSGSPVTAICDGIVKIAIKGGNIWNRFTIVEHTNCGKYKTLYAYYGHIDPSVNVGNSITRGQRIGSVGYYSENNHHLHFGLATQFFSQGWGYQGGNLEGKGWINSESFF